jgi:hypothetical protein
MQNRTSVPLLFCMSLISTGSSWRRRYLECRVITAVPDEEVEYIENYEVEACYMREEAKYMHATEPVFECGDAHDIVDLFKAIATNYFESKGYDHMMLMSASWYMGCRCEIYDWGSQNRYVNVRRWYDVFHLIPGYWEDLYGACRDFVEQAYAREYRHSQGKGVRW